MNLLVVLLTFNRKEYSQKTLDNLIATIKVPHYILAVDNASTDGTQEWLQKELHDGRINKIVLNEENFYPGKAMNIAWTEGIALYPEATHLMRLDNDMKLEPGWDEICQKYFEKIPNLGQIGLEHGAIEHPDAMSMSLKFDDLTLVYWPGNVGGPNIITRRVWEQGLRYREDKWDHHGLNRPTPQEDALFSMDINQAGYLFGHTIEKIGVTFANHTNWKDYPEYYLKTMKERGYDDVYRDTLRELEEQSSNAASK